MTATTVWFLWGMVCSLHECYWVKVQESPEYKNEKICEWAADRLHKNTVMYFSVICEPRGVMPG